MSDIIVHGGKVQNALRAEELERQNTILRQELLMLLLMTSRRTDEACKKYIEDLLKP